ncbi:MAG: hypothetical protein ISS70_23075 [Phycisphaerae bacterium]|nr:hypothetical protein [Phycisphaerae bacterium]
MIVLPKAYIHLIAACAMVIGNVVNPVSAKTYYACPQGGGDGSSVESPFAVEDFWNEAQPGDTLILLDGLYTGPRSMVKPPENLSGTKDSPITVRALRDGKVTIDGKGVLQPISLYHNDWWVVEGIDACNSKSTVVSLSRSNHCIIRRMCGWNAADGNTNIFAAHYGEHNLFEDCAGWGIARKTFSCSQGGNYTTFRRCFGSWEGCHNVGPKMAFTLFYNSHHIAAENCIATWDGKLMRESYTVAGYDGKPFTQWKDGSGKPRHYSDYGVDQPYGCFGMDRIDRGPTKGPFVYGCIAYRLKSQRVVSTPGLFFMRCRQPHDGWFENCAALVEAGAADVRTFNLTNVDGRNLTAVGGLNPGFGKGDISNIFRGAGTEGPAAWRGMFRKETPERGAHLYYRYENGKLTDKPLWPWPMNDRIRELTGMDLTATISGLAQ